MFTSKKPICSHQFYPIFFRLKPPSPLLHPFGSADRSCLAIKQTNHRGHGNLGNVVKGDSQWPHRDSQWAERFFEAIKSHPPVVGWMLVEGWLKVGWMLVEWLVLCCLLIDCLSWLWWFLLLMLFWDFCWIYVGCHPEWETSRNPEARFTTTNDSSSGSLQWSTWKNPMSLWNLSYEFPPWKFLLNKKSPFPASLAASWPFCEGHKTSTRVAWWN